MAATLRIARPEDAAAVLRLVTVSHDETGQPADPATREIAIDAILSGDVPGALYLIGPPSSPVGYLSISFGHSLATGTTARLEEIFLRAPVRGRGMGTEAVQALSKMLEQNGIAQLSATVPETDSGFFQRLRFQPSGGTDMVRAL